MATGNEGGVTFLEYRRVGNELHEFAYEVFTWGGVTERRFVRAVPDIVPEDTRGV